ncbi:Serine/threonine-protein phosphatase 2A activator 2 [Escovopsis weberi]|uniref:Serine/threonine-protein phosphatase 2A activator n=1 Tax=Escovopsis weberi TaxID=150374 RepID=A0A0M8MZ94_ESCWE|nr:Serine/threonine-protein phosphatase 2A activator 2 [Escovopsis weberi]
MAFPQPSPSASKFQIPKLEPRKRRSQPQNPLPVPETPPLPPPSHPLIPSSFSSFSSSSSSSSSSLASASASASPTHPPPFQIPKRRILTPDDHALFLASPTKDLIVSWIFHLSASVASLPRSKALAAPASPAIRAILDILQDAHALVLQIPPEDSSGSRFGNKSFRLFLDALARRSPQWHAALLRTEPLNHPEPESEPRPDRLGPADEVQTYFLNAFGDRTRIDYGSGHELNFFMWLLALYNLGLFPSISASTSSSASTTSTSATPSPDLQHIVCAVFPRYLALMRAVQTTYYLEPAGSHGVWGLDDYQFLPFLFGASQLLRHPFITPRSIHQDLTIEEAAPDFLYLDQVAFVNSTKSVRGLRWHSPMLDDISAAKSWDKIDHGMRRMFAAEVLGKLPVMQHFLFGSIIPAADGMTEDDALTDDAAGQHRHDDDGDDAAGAAAVDRHVGHAHDGKGWGDCCGIKVPSSIAAAQEAKKGSQGQTLRRIPFD